MKLKIQYHLKPARALTALIVFFSFPAFAGTDYRHVTFHPVPLSDVQTPVTPEQIIPLTSIDSSSNHIFQSTIADEYRQSIQALESSQGPYNSLISEQAESLGDLLADMHDLEGARSAYEKAIQIIRINKGLLSAEQEPILEKMIQAEMADQNIGRADELAQSLLHLKTRLYPADSQEYIDTILEWADWKVERFLMEKSSRSVKATDSQLPATHHLVEAQKRYLEAIGLINKSMPSGDSINDDLIHAQKRLAAINYMASKFTAGNKASDYRMSFDNDMSDQFITDADSTGLAYFFNGSNALKQAIAYSLEDPNPNYLSIAEQMMSLGDWNLLFGRKTAALSIYENAYDVLDAMQVPENEKKRIMNSGMPLTTSTLSARQDGAKDSEYHGYIDIELTVSKFGTATKPEVIGSSQGLESPLTRALIRQIRSEKFRPAFVDGSAAGSDNLKLRYYYSYN